jgi:hypothetical protein
VRDRTNGNEMNFFNWIKSLFRPDPPPDPPKTDEQIEYDMKQDIRQQLMYVGDVVASGEARGGLRQVFLSHLDVIKWLKDIGVSGDYINIVEMDDWDTDGNTAYGVFVQDSDR